MSKECKRGRIICLETDCLYWSHLEERCRFRDWGLPAEQHLEMIQAKLKIKIIAGGKSES